MPDFYVTCHLGLHVVRSGDWGSPVPMEAVVAISEYAFALSILLGTLLVPFLVSYQMLRLKRRAIRVTATTATRGSRR